MECHYSEYYFFFLMVMNGFIHKMLFTTKILFYNAMSI